MMKHFLKLEWKAFFRSASFGKSLGIKIFMGFMALYFMTFFLIGGFFMDKILEKVFPKLDLITAFCGLLFFWILGDLIFRFFFQKLPVMSVKPLLTLPVSRNKIVHYVLGKSALSFFNFLPLFAIIPFGIKLLFKDYPTGSVLILLLALFVTTLIINFLNFIIESFSAETELSFLPVILLTGGLFALNYYEIISFKDLIGNAFIAIYESPLLILVLLLILAITYIFNFKLLHKKLFLDSGLKTEVKEVNASNLDWTKNFGDIAPFMQLDLRLIWRNKRTKSSVWMLAIGLLYGLFFYPNPTYNNMPFFFIFIGIFSTGIFLINFGQFVPAWDSGYYKLLMSQNIKYEQYLKSKFTLMALSVVVLFVLGIPYVYFGWKILFAHFAAAIYNIGINTHVILWGGSFNRKKIDLSQKAAFNYQGTGAVQWLIGIPLLVLPMLIFALLNWLLSFEIACIVLIAMGVLGIVFHEKLMRFITGKYLESKYKMIDAFDQDN
ncbi:hypothetical protein SAMN05421824_0384 [Hyunsoonleella jejuensis]|uniref:ABC-2 type transport system permease protein n=1 Tax=Hyunsoonleella jejuensis TaxID=419940 RepID=A0A1H9AY21_9FLAO|nr:DUF5687 family protein [Hyunsoonleella jejuensis]SEP81333.1 hypothetical protein SAMN05421824_0384 [Hyunsoonleella jejuensis]